MPFRQPGSDVYRTRVTLPDGKRCIRSCGTTDRTTARLVEGAVRDLQSKRQWQALEAVFRRELSLGQVYDAVRSGTLDSLLAAANDVDLAELLGAYEHYLRGRGLQCVDDYMEHVRAYVGTSRKVSTFTKPDVSRHLSELSCSGATRNRHRGSLTQFAEWLVETGKLLVNPVRGIRGAKENRPRMVYYSEKESLDLLRAMEWPYQAIGALMCGSGMEWAAIERLALRDVNFANHTVHARGTKNEWRDREVLVDSPYWEIFAIYARRCAGGLLFGGVKNTNARNAHQAAAKALQLQHSTLHDWRHTYAVRHRRKGTLDSVIAHQLGHRDTKLVATRYGRFRVEAHDYHQRVNGNGQGDAQTAALHLR